MQKHKKSAARAVAPVPGEDRSTAARTGKIHPVIIYPYSQPTDLTDLQSLYDWVGSLAKDRDRYTRPITVIDRKTHYAMRDNPAFDAFRKNSVEKDSDVLDAWCVDTCQMWYCGLGAAFEKGTDGDIYWLIPGDFNYGTNLGREVLARLHDLPEIVEELEQDLCIGEIATDHSHSKQLIDTYGTFALLYNWFPEQAEEIRKFTERPRSEFFAVRHRFLKEILSQRWFAYEQTVVMLLHAVFNGKCISRFFVGNISDLPEGRDSISAALQQVERTERVLKTIWRERNQASPGWLQRYCALDTQSEQIRKTALTILQNLLQ